MDTRIDLTKDEDQIGIKDCYFCDNHILNLTTNNNGQKVYRCNLCKDEIHFIDTANDLKLTKSQLVALFNNRHLELNTKSPSELLIVENKCEKFIHIFKSKLNQISTKKINHKESCTNKDNTRSLMRIYKDDSESYIWCPECHVFSVLTSTRNNLNYLDNQYIPEYFLNKKSNKFNQRLDNINSNEQEYNEVEGRNIPTNEQEELDKDPNKFDFFISHSSDDRILYWNEIETKILKKDENKFKYWICNKEITAGTIFMEPIIKQIKSSNALLLLASENAFDSDQVTTELSVAMENDKEVYVISLKQDINEDTFFEKLQDNFKQEFKSKQSRFIWIGYYKDSELIYNSLYFLNYSIQQAFHYIVVAYDQETLNNKKYKKGIETFTNILNKDDKYIYWSTPLDKYKALSKKILSLARVIFVVISDSLNKSDYICDLIAYENSNKSEYHELFQIKIEDKLDCNPTLGLDQGVQWFSRNDISNKELIYNFLDSKVSFNYDLFFYPIRKDDFTEVKDLANKLKTFKSYYKMQALDENAKFEDKQKHRKKRWEIINQTKIILFALTPSFFEQLKATYLEDEIEQKLEDLRLDINQLVSTHKHIKLIVCVTDPNYNKQEVCNIIKRSKSGEYIWYQTRSKTWITRKDSKSNSDFTKKISDSITQNIRNFDKKYKVSKINQTSFIQKCLNFTKNATNTNDKLLFIIIISILLVILGIVINNNRNKDLALANSPIDRIIVKNNKTTKAIDTQNFGIGSIIRFGTYWNKPIYWIYAFDDQDGNQVFISREIVTFKPFDVAHNNLYAKLSNGTAIDLHPMPDETIHKYMNRFTTSKWIDSVGDNSWEHSTLRTWLNSNAMNVPYEFHAPSIDNTNQETAGPIGTAYVEKINEPGFLAEFNDHELKLLEAKDHDLILSVYNKDSSSKGDQLFNFFDNLDPEQNLYKDTLKAKAKPFIFDFQSVYKKTLQDKVTIPSLEDFIIISQDQRIDLQYTKEIFSATGDSFVLPLTRWWLDTPCGYTPTTVCNVLGSDFNKDKPIIKIAPSSDFSGVRPMIRLPFKSYKMKGAGTLEDPYFIDFDSL